MAKERKKLIVLGIFIVIVVIAAVAAYFFFIHTKICDSKECFESSLETCSRAEYLEDGEDATWQYTIIGESGGECVVNSQILQVKTGTIDLEKIQGLDMDCSLPLGYVASPSEDLTRCHGLLKEEMQDMIIRKMHSYILTNVGRISEELNKAV